MLPVTEINVIESSCLLSAPLQLNPAEAAWGSQLMAAVMRRVKPKLLFGFTVISGRIQMGKASLTVDGIQKCEGFPRPAKSWLCLADVIPWD